MRFEFIFVRHAESCANAWEERTYVGQLVYKDPELTPRGVTRSNAKYPLIKETLDRYFPSYTICSSPMLRAQQTAYHMLAKHVDKSINIVPFLNEYGITPNNLPYNKDRQITLIKTIEPNMLENLHEGKDSRHHQSIFNKTNYSKFLKWAKDHLDYFQKGDDDVYRSVIFTHGKLLRNIFPLKDAVPPVKGHKHYNNNDFILFAVGEDSKVSDIPMEPHFLYFDTSHVKGDSAIESSCSSEMCRIPISCKKGGTRKLKHIRKQTRRKNRRF